MKNQRNIFDSSQFSSLQSADMRIGNFEKKESEFTYLLNQDFLVDSLINNFAGRIILSNAFIGRLHSINWSNNSMAILPISKTDQEDKLVW